MVVDYTGHGKTPKLLEYTDDNTTVAWGPVTTKGIVSIDLGVGGKEGHRIWGERETHIYWSDNVLGNPNITDEAFQSHRVCIYRFRKDKHPMTRWPGDVVDCEPPLGIKYMSEGSRRRACHNDDLCASYGMWHGDHEEGSSAGIENGDFESTAFDVKQITLSGGDTTPDKFGWEIIKGNVIILRATDDSINDIPSGEKIMDINGDKQGTVSQVINTRIGQKHLLSFFASANVEAGLDEPMKTLQIFWSGCFADACVDFVAGEDSGGGAAFSMDTANRVSELTLYAGGLTRTDMKWKHYIFEVTATGDTSRVTFAPGTPGDGGFVLDKIELTLAAPMHDVCAAIGVDLDIEVVRAEDPEVLLQVRHGAVRHLHQWQVQPRPGGAPAAV